MPWQQMVADVAGEIDDEGMPAYREVIFSTPRQSGKTILQLAMMIQRATGWAAILGQPQKMSYTAQTGLDASKKLLIDWHPILWPRRQRLGISAIPKANGNQGIIWKNGSRMSLMGSGEDAGHGSTLDAAMKDELFADTDGRRDQALIPAMATKPFGQMWTASTMGTPASIPWNGKVQLGRAAVDAGKTEGTAYFEWSADPTWDLLNPDLWPLWMPAIGYTQSTRTIQHALDTFVAEGKLGEFRRAFGNIQTDALEQTIPAPAWANVCSPLVEAEASCFGLDTNPDRTRTSIVACGGRKIEVVEVENGTAGVIDRCKALNVRYNVPIVIAATGPAAAFVSDLRAERVEVVEITARDETRAAQEFLDAVVNGTIEVKTDADLDDAIRAATKRTVGDAWAWGRKSSQRDISPLVAASIGLFQAKIAPATANIW